MHKRKKKNPLCPASNWRPECSDEDCVCLRISKLCLLCKYLFAHYICLQIRESFSLSASKKGQKAVSAVEALCLHCFCPPNLRLISTWTAPSSGHWRHWLQSKEQHQQHRGHSWLDARLRHLRVGSILSLIRLSTPYIACISRNALSTGHIHLHLQQWRESLQLQYTGWHIFRRT